MNSQSDVTKLPNCLQSLCKKKLMTNYSEKKKKKSKKSKVNIFGNFFRFTNNQVVLKH